MIKFDIVNEKYRDCIKNDGTLLAISHETSKFASFSILSSNSFSSGDIGEFSIKCNKPSQDSIGIMSNTSIITMDDCYHAEADAQFYYYYLYGNLYETDKDNGGYKGIFDRDVESAEANDVVTVKVNCVDWTLRFMLNNKLMGKPIKIKPEEKYHPFVGIYEVDGEYELLF